MTPTDKNLRAVLEKAWRGGFTTKSDFARRFANQVAVAASLGYITTQVRGFSFGSTWLITKDGLSILNECF